MTCGDAAVALNGYQMTVPQKRIGILAKAVRH